MPKSAPGTKTVSVIMPIDVYESLKTWAETKDWSISQAAKNLIVDALGKELGSPSPKKSKK